MSYSSANFTKTAFPMLDMMLQMQQIGLQAMTMYQPTMTATRNSAKAAEGGAGYSPISRFSGRAHDVADRQERAQEQVIQLGEEVLNVGTRMVPGNTTRVRRVVVEAPVQQDVTLHTETVVVERRKPMSATGEGILTEVTVEMSDFNEVPVVSKSVRLVEEVLLRKEITARIETIHDTVKRDTLEIEQPSQLPMVVDVARVQEDKLRAERRSAEQQDKKLGAVAGPADQKHANQPSVHKHH